MMRGYGLNMKNANPILILTAAAGSTLLTGCASMNHGYTDVAGARSALAFTTVTDEKQMMKWTGDPFLMRSLRSIDTYYFQVPDTGFRPGGIDVSRRDNDRVIVHDDGSVAVYNNGRPDVGVNPDRVTIDTSPREGMGGSAPYQTESGGYKVIEYRPGHSL
jgi:hypothetical protein